MRRTPPPTGESELDSLTQQLHAALEGYHGLGKDAIGAVKEAYGDLVSLYAGRLRANAIHRARYAGSPQPLEDGDEVLQVACMRGWELLLRPGFSPSGEDWFARWISRIIAFVALEHARRGWLAWRGSEAARWDFMQAYGEPREAQDRLERTVLLREALELLRCRATTAARKKYLSLFEHMLETDEVDVLAAATSLGVSSPRSLAAAAVRWARAELRGTESVGPVGRSPNSGS